LLQPEANFSLIIHKIAFYVYKGSLLQSQRPPDTLAGWISNCCELRGMQGIGLTGMGPWMGQKGKGLKKEEAGYHPLEPTANRRHV